MGHLLNMGIKMQAAAATTTTTTTSATKTVQWSYDPLGCSGMTAQVLKNASSIFSGGSASSGSFTVVPGDTITVSNTIGPKPSLACNQANALIGSTLGGGEYGSQTVTGANNTATVTYTVVSGTASTIYVTAGLAIA